MAAGRKKKASAAGAKADARRGAAGAPRTWKKASKKTSKKKASKKKASRKSSKKAARRATRRPERAADPASDAAPGGAPVLVRLNKLLADHGLASRRAADELIAAGQVSIDGVCCTELGRKVDPNRETVEVAGEVLTGAGVRRRYYLLNKPPGVVCTNERREVRPRAVDLITDRDKGRIYTVGRLDEESKGLILLTNDGDFANRVMHPRYGVPKTYLVKLRGRIGDEELQKLRGGVHLSEGRTGGARIVVRKRTREYTHLIVTLREGMNRELRRMFARVGFNVIDLRRARIGALTDRGLKLGSWRHLTPAEVRELLAGGGDDAAPGPGPRRKKQAATRPTRRRS